MARELRLTMPLPGLQLFHWRACNIHLANARASVRPAQQQQQQQQQRIGTTRRRTQRQRPGATHVPPPFRDHPATRARAMVIGSLLHALHTCAARCATHHLGTRCNRAGTVGLIWFLHSGQDPSGQPAEGSTQTLNAESGVDQERLRASNRIMTSEGLVAIAAATERSMSWRQMNGAWAIHWRTRHGTQDTARRVPVLRQKSCHTTKNVYVATRNDRITAATTGARPRTRGSTRG